MKYTSMSGMVWNLLIVDIGKQIWRNGPLSLTFQESGVHAPLTDP